jgi:hypothetical protein
VLANGMIYIQKMHESMVKGQLLGGMEYYPPIVFKELSIFYTAIITCSVEQVKVHTPPAVFLFKFKINSLGRISISKSHYKDILIGSRFMGIINRLDSNELINTTTDIDSGIC